MREDVALGLAALRGKAPDNTRLFVAPALAAGRSETWVADRTGHRSSIMINRYRRAARTANELDLGELVSIVLTPNSGTSDPQFVPITVLPEAAQ